MDMEEGNDGSLYTDMEEGRDGSLNKDMEDGGICFLPACPHTLASLFP